MAIYTRFGTEVDVIAVEEDEYGQVFVTVQSNIHPDWLREYPLYELRADGGMDELIPICRAINPKAF